MICESALHGRDEERPISMRVEHGQAEIGASIRIGTSKLDTNNNIARFRKIDGKRINVKCIHIFKERKGQFGRYRKG